MTVKRFTVQDEKVLKDNQKYVAENGYVFSYKSDAEEVCNLLNELYEENEQLKYNLAAHMVDLNNYTGKCSALEIENEQLKQRNDRQAKQLDRLYNLIEQKDWRTLNDILDDFKRCEEQFMLDDAGDKE